MSEILEYCSVTQSQVNTCLKKTMANIFAGVDLRRTPEDIVDRVIFKLRLSEEIRVASRYTATRLRPLMEGKPPKTIAAVALHMVTHLKAANSSQRNDILHKIGDAVEITKTTIQNNARKVHQFREQVLPVSL